jgi:TolB-like protein/DNA-binding winged helix-turn-helix (wHTH) protein/Flp pilus assembly protein TadD
MPQPHVVRFGPFAVDLQSGDLSKDGSKKSRLQGQPLQVLAILLECLGQIVTRDELRARLWDKHTFVDFEHGLHATVNKLRYALNDSADHPSYIETIPRRGYRFIGTLDSVAQDEGSSRAQPRRLALALVGAAAAALAVAIAVVYWPLRDPAPATPASNSRVMLAVLPFENVSGDASQEFFSDGLTEELITRLGQADPSRLGVIARTSVLGYKKTTKPIREISRELGVDYVLEGTVRHAGSRVRISAQLIRARDETHLWAASFDRTLEDLLRVQTEIARAVASGLQLRLPGADRAAWPSRPQVSWEAYEAALRGRHFLEQRTADGIRLARENFERAIALEPGYAFAYVGLADAHLLSATYSDVPASEAMARARKAVLTARELDDHEPAAHAWLGIILAEHDWDWTGAEREFRRAIELNPNFAYAHKLYAEHLSYMGRFDEAIAEARLARRLDPLSVVANGLVGLVLYRARQYESASEALERANELDPGHPLPYLPLGLALSMLERHDEAVAALEQGVAASARNSEMLAQLALVYGRAGRNDRARAVLAELERRAESQHVSPFALALVHTGLGDRDAAIGALESAYRAREWYLCVLKTEPTLDPLRPDPRYQDLLRKVDLAPASGTASGR